MASVRLVRRHLFGALLPLAMLARYGGSVAAQSVEGFDLDAALAGIQATLDARVAAIAAQDEAALLATIDLRNATWRRIQRGRLPLEQGLLYRVTDARPLFGGYAKAALDVAPLEGDQSQVLGQAVWVYHQGDDGQWLLAEPLSEELAQRKLLATPHFALRYYAWDDEWIDRLSALVEQVYEAVTATLQQRTDLKATLYVSPTYASAPQLSSGLVGALYNRSSGDTIWFFSPESFGAGILAPGRTQEEHLLPTFTHEYTHLVHDHAVPLAKQPLWLLEGLAEYVAGNLHPEIVREALRANHLVALEKASDIIQRAANPSSGYAFADLSLAYAEGAHAVAFLVRQYTWERFWALARDYAGSQNWAESAQRVLGQPWATVDAEWQRWLRAQF